MGARIFLGIVFFIALVGIGISSNIFNQSSTTGNLSSNSGNTSLKPNSSLVAELNSTEMFVQTVNQSAYLFFYPNLQKSYLYLNEANSLISQNPSKASELIYDAHSYAESQLYSLDRYRVVSFFATIIITALLGIWIYRIYSVKAVRKRRGRLRS